MNPIRLKTRFKKFLQYLTLGSFSILLAVLFGLGRYPMSVGLARVDATVPEASAVQSSAGDTSELVQEGLQLYQSGQFAAAVTLWKQAGDAFAAQGDGINQAMVLSNLALA